VRKLSILSQPAYVYGVIYLAIIPIYVVLYLAIIDKFHSTTSKYETHLLDDGNALTDSLKKAMIYSVLHYPHALTTSYSTVIYYGENIPRHYTHLIDSLEEQYRNNSLIQLSQLEYNEQMRRFEINLNTVYKLGFDVRKTRAGVDDTTIFSLHLFLIEGGDYGHFWPQYIAWLDSSHFHYAYEELKEGPFIGEKHYGNPNPNAQVTFIKYDTIGEKIYVKLLVSDDPIFRISPAVYNRFMAFQAILTGSLSKYSSGNIERMFYLSAMTITTVGYGDIVPITWQSRTLVASEAILGIILIGLFINNAAFKRNSNTRKTTNRRGRG